MKWGTVLLKKILVHNEMFSSIIKIVLLCAVIAGVSAAIVYREPLQLHRARTTEVEPPELMEDMFWAYSFETVTAAELDAGKFPQGEEFLVSPHEWNIFELYNQSIPGLYFPWEATCHVNWDSCDDEIRQFEKDKYDIEQILKRNAHILENVRMHDGGENFAFNTKDHNGPLRRDLDRINGACFVKLSSLVVNAAVVKQAKGDKNAIEECLFFLRLCKRYTSGENASSYVIITGMIATMVTHVCLAELIGKIDDERLILKVIDSLRAEEPDYEILIKFYELRKTRHPKPEIVGAVIEKLKLLKEDERSMEMMPKVNFYGLWPFSIAKTQNKILRLEAAIRLYWIKEKKMPETLEELIPDYIDKIPIDPYSGRPLRYDKVNRKIWSIGLDFIDDHGVIKADCDKRFNEPTLQLFWK